MLIEFTDADDGSVSGSVAMQIDPQGEIITLESKAGREPAALIARIMREAGDFFVEQLTADD